MARRVFGRVLGNGIVAAALALGLLAGCDEGTTNTSPSESADAIAPSASASASAVPVEGDEGSAGPLQGEIEKLLEASPIKFNPHSAELTEESEATLKKIAEAAAEDESAKLAVKATAGYEDADKAKALSQQRVDAVIKELTDNGVAEDRLEGEALGNEGVTGDITAATTLEITVS